jgi:hypothetical protein
MTTLESYWRALPHRDDLTGFDERQSRAFLELLICMALADNEVTAVERLGFAQAVLSLPPFEAGDWSVFESTEAVEWVARCKDRLDQNGDAYLDELVGEFTGADAREFVFTAVVRFTTPDGWNDDEHAFAKRLGDRFGFDETNRDNLLANALLRMEQSDD